ncbi:hypothetical protein L1I30_10895 [Gillisia sp. M10.2A]|uniref:Glycosyltransferase RgtA/B/C/D-like domain-containing protein n=1 Tax=Gillisia lutea TaxID=2909668 RepID=A0ABS9EH39_9FLAO|nr:hypothetical protein [Gillisia lutea]MCF4102176.1 hypothetical protein [Gillisia lutea]
MRINSRRYFWKIWMIFVFIIATIFFTVLDYAPFLHIDEFTIVDLGRTILNPRSDWSITWMISENHPAINVFYLGAVFQELTLQALGEYGPRISGIIGALVAATVLMAWLLKRRTPHKIVLILGLVFLLDPIFVQAYTVGRLDGWAMAFCFLSCLSLRQDIYRSFTGLRSKLFIVFAGIAAALAIFIWPSAALLYPLILMELFLVTKKYRLEGKNIKNTLRPSILFSFGALLAVILLTIPIASLLKSSLSSILDGILLNLHYGAANGVEQQSFLSSDGIITLLRILKFSPFLVILALTAAVIKRNSELIVAGILATMVIVLSLVYLNRVLYLIPYMILLVAAFYSNYYKLSWKSGASSFKIIGLILLLIWPISISIIGRTTLAVQIRNEDNRKLMHLAAKEMIGPGNYSVYLPGPEFYYAGRALGWKMYRPYAAFGDTLSSAMLKEMIPKLDYVIMPEWEEDKVFDSLLTKKGIVGNGWYALYEKQAQPQTVKTTNLHRLRNLFFIHPKAYGPYKLYARRKNTGLQIGQRD